MRVKVEQRWPNMVGGTYMYRLSTKRRWWTPWLCRAHIWAISLSDAQSKANEYLDNNPPRIEWEYETEKWGVNR